MNYQEEKRNREIFVAYEEEIVYQWFLENITSITGDEDTRVIPAKLKRMCGDVAQDIYNEACRLFELKAKF